jgi:transposase-like protein
LFPPGVTVGPAFARRLLEAARLAAIIRHVQEVTGNVAMNCRHYGISRQVFCTWLRRYEADG